MRRIQALVDQVPFPGRNRAVGFWMDTLCIPVDDDDLRKECISKMRFTYSRASAALVLDSWMQTVSHTSFILETALHITLSNHNRRLWTLQEILLPDVVYYQLSDKCLEIRQIDRDVRMLEAQWEPRGVFTPSAKHALGDRPIQQGLLRDSFVYNNEDPVKSAQNGLLPLTIALSQRATSRQIDETICLSTVMGISPIPFLDIKESNGYPKDNIVDLRMIELFKKLRVINLGLIFTPQPRIRLRGFRWAPRSFLNSREADYSVFEGNRTGMLESRDGVRGLAVALTGYRFHLDSLAQELNRWQQPVPEFLDGQLVGSPDSWRRMPWRQNMFTLGLYDEFEKRSILQVRLQRDPRDADYQGDVEFDHRAMYVLITQKDMELVVAACMGMEQSQEIAAIVAKVAPEGSKVVEFVCRAAVTWVECDQEEDIPVEGSSNDWLIL
jgi:hypothetical protein